MSERAHRLLRRLAGRAASDPTYLGWLLERYRASEGLSRSALAALLKMDEDSLPNLSLCLRPRGERFAADVMAVATHVGADPTALAAVIRQVDAVDAMAVGGAATDRGFLLAARAREISREANPNPSAKVETTHEPHAQQVEDRSAGGEEARFRHEEEGA